MAVVQVVEQDGDRDRHLHHHGGFHRLTEIAIHPGQPPMSAVYLRVEATYDDGRGGWQDRYGRLGIHDH